MSEFSFSNSELIAGYNEGLGLEAAFAMNGLLTATRLSYKQISEGEQATVNPQIQLAFTRYEKTAGEYLGRSVENDNLAARRRSSTCDTLPKLLEVATPAHADLFVTDEQLGLRTTNEQALDEAVNALTEPIINAFRDKLPQSPPPPKKRWGRKQETPSPITLKRSMPGTLAQVTTAVPTPNFRKFSSLDTKLIEASTYDSRDIYGDAEMYPAIRVNLLKLNPDDEQLNVLSMAWRIGNDAAQHVIGTCDPGVSTLLANIGYADGNEGKARGKMNHFNIDLHNQTFRIQNWTDHSVRDLSSDPKGYEYRFDAERNVFTGIRGQGQPLPEVSVNEYLDAIKSMLSIFPLVELPQIEAK